MFIYKCLKCLLKAMWYLIIIHGNRFFFKLKITKYSCMLTLYKNILTMTYVEFHLFMYLEI